MPECIDCGQSVPQGVTRCDVCVAAWNPFGWNVGQRGHPTVQPGIQKLHRQEILRLLSTDTAHDAQLRDGKEEREVDV